MADRFQTYMQYIKNTGGSPKIECFDDDWEPIGPMVRKDMENAGLIIYTSDGKIQLADKMNTDTNQIIRVKTQCGVEYGVMMHQIVWVRIDPDNENQSVIKMAGEDYVSIDEPYESLMKRVEGR